MGKDLIKKIKNILQKEDNVLFAYLYGSSLSEKNYRDIDVGVYIRDDENQLSYSADLKFKISQKLNISPDMIDIQIINNASNPFFLYDVLNGILLVDKDPEVRGDFIERFSMQYRESEGILDEAYS